MLNQFRHLYPQGSLVSELINIDHGLYIVKVSVQNQNTILGTGLAAAETVEKAEDKARERALMTITLEKPLNSQTKPSKPLIPQNVVSESSNKELTAIATTENNYNSFSVTSPTEVSEPFSSPEPEDFLPPPTEETIPITEPQTNIFDQPLTPTTEETIPVAIENENTVELDFNVIRHKIDLEMKRLSWTKEQGRDYLLSTYGKRSRLHLTDDELLEFWHHLETLPS